jgi:hypothetical protein
MNRGRVTRRVIPLLIGLVLFLSACADRSYDHDRPYYEYDRWGFWDGFGGFDHDPRNGDFHHDGRRHGYVRHAGYARHGSWHGGWGHGIAGHGGYGGHGGHGGHGGGGHR